MITFLNILILSDAKNAIKMENDSKKCTHILSILTGIGAVAK